MIMSPQDTQMLQDFLGQLTQARGIQKDPEADALIRRAVDQQPDAAYLLVQRALLLDQALNNAKSQIASLENQVNQLSRQGQQGQQDANGRFLDANSWGNSGGARPAQQQSYQRDVQTQYQTHQQPQYQPQYPGQYQPAYPQPGLSSGFLRGGLGGGMGGGMLGTIAATAAGVAAGNFLFQGLGNMFGHHDSGNLGGNHLLNSDDSGNNLFSDQSGSALADQAGLGDVGSALGGGGLDSGGLDSGASEGLFDSSVDDVSDNSGGFFDGDGSDEGLFG
jgi:hypothetical protein